MLFFVLLVILLDTVNDEDHKHASNTTVNRSYEHVFTSTEMFMLTVYK